MDTPPRKRQKYLLFIVFLVIPIAIYSIIQYSNLGRNQQSATPQPGENNTVITFAGNEFDRAIYEPLINDFHKIHPNITVQYVILPSDIQNKDFNALISLADTTSFPTTPSEVSNYYLNLDPLLENDSDFKPDDFWPGILSACQTEDKHQLGIPLTVNIKGVFFEKQAFNDAGLPYPVSGWTWDDFRQAVIALAHGSETGFKYGFADFGTLRNSILAPLIDAHLASVGGDFDFDLLAQELQWYVDLARSSELYPIKDINNFESAWNEWQALFNNGLQPSMWIGSLDSSVPGDQFPVTDLAITMWGFAPFPSNENTLSSLGTSPIAVRCVGISAGTSSPRAAWQWLKFLSQQWIIDRNLIGGNMQIPARQSVTNTVNFWENLPTGVEATVRFALEHAWYGTQFVERFNQIEIALINATRRNIDLVSALADASASVQPTPKPTEISVQHVATPQPTMSEDTLIINYYFLSYDEREKEALRTFATEFSQTYPDIHIQLWNDFGDQVDQDTITSLAAQFDCFSWTSPYWVTQKPDSLLALNPLLDAEGSSFKLDFDPETFKVFENDGQLYALPAFSTSPIMSYNADLLDTHGLKPPAIDWTFDDFVNLATAAASTSELQKSYGYLYNMWDGLFFASRGVHIADFTTSPPIAYFGTTETIQTFSWLAGLKNSGVLLVNDQSNWASVQNAMVSGQVAFWISEIGHPEGPYFSTQTQATFEIGVVPLPSLSDPNKSVSWRTETGYYISRQTKNPEVCWDWIKFLSEKPIAFSGVPARYSVAQSPDWETTVGSEEAAVYRIALGQGKHWDGIMPDPTINSPLSFLWSQSLNAIFEGSDPTQVLTEAQQKADAYLACIATIQVSELNANELQNEVATCTHQAGIEGN
ncbi:MAG: hypothetical protein Fur0022_43460 [Anaerolineales bacterium]